jgi:DDE superfamily endonuclease
MQTLPVTIIKLMSPFRPTFDKRTWAKGKELMMGAILSTGKRTVTAALRVMGHQENKNYAKYHQVLNRAKWSAHELSHKLLKLMLSQLDKGEGALVFGIDETIERRWGLRIKSRGIYRDPVRSSRSHFVKARGLRWVSLMWLTRIAWAERIWALPFLTVLAPSERSYEEKKRSAKSVLDWARQMVYQLRRWLPNRLLVRVADSSYAALEFLLACQTLPNPVAVITRLRLDAALYTPVPQCKKGTLGRKRKKGRRLPTPQAFVADPRTRWVTVMVNWYGGQLRRIEIASGFALWYHSGKPAVTIRWVLIRDPLDKFEPQAFLATDRTLNPLQIVEWFVQRWPLEVTFAEVRSHLGVESQRQWSDLAIARTTPILLALFSWITLAADALLADGSASVQQAAWYTKLRPTFADALAWVRKALWLAQFDDPLWPFDPDKRTCSHPLFDRLLDTVCYAT